MNIQDTIRLSDPELLARAKRYRDYGPAYNRHIAVAAEDLEKMIEAGLPDKIVNVARRMLTSRLCRWGHLFTLVNNTSMALSPEEWTELRYRLADTGETGIEGVKARSYTSPEGEFRRIIERTV